MLKQKLPPKVWFHGSPVLEERPHLREHLLVCDQHALRVDHALGQPGRAGSEQDLRRRVGTQLGEDFVDARAGRGVEQRRERRRLGAYGGERRAVPLRIVRPYQARLEQLEDRPQLGEILRHQRVRGRNRRHRHARVHGAEREQAVVDAVVGEDGERLLGAETALEQRLADAPRTVQRLRIGKLAPAVARSLGEEHALRRLLRPLREPLAHAALVGAQLLRRAQDHRAVVAALDVDCGGREAQPGMQTHGSFLLLVYYWHAQGRGCSRADCNGMHDRGRGAA